MLCTAAHYFHRHHTAHHRTTTYLHTNPPPTALTHPQLCTVLLLCSALPLAAVCTEINRMSFDFITRPSSAQTHSVICAYTCCISGRTICACTVNWQRTVVSRWSRRAPCKQFGTHTTQHLDGNGNEATQQTSDFPATHIIFVESRIINRRECAKKKQQRNKTNQPASSSSSSSSWRR